MWLLYIWDEAFTVKNANGMSRAHRYNLNRMWNRTSLTTSPEVLVTQVVALPSSAMRFHGLFTAGHKGNMMNAVTLFLQAAMYKYGVDIFFDVHGDELENYNLVLYPPANLPNLTPQINTTIVRFPCPFTPL